MPFCAHCGTAVNAVSYAPCPSCGRPTNGAPPRPIQTGGGSKVALVIVAVVAAGLVVIAIVGILAAIAIPNLLTAMERSKQKRTMADVRTVATAVEAYAVDHKQYPNAIDVSSLSGSLVPTYIRSIPAVDGWGHALHYDAWASQAGGATDSYAIGSGGKDGAFTHQHLREYLASPHATRNFNDDIVYSNGSFVLYPEGTQVQ